jgi:AcrR family transcriptional regulator
MSGMVDEVRPGLRERKKIKTRQTIRREALRLIEEQGYDETTVEQIAEAAEISPSTFFRYYRTKDDVIVEDEYDPLIEAAVRARPADESAWTALRNGVRDVFIGTVFGEDREEFLARTRVMHSVPALKARMFENSEPTRQLIAALLAERIPGSSPDDFELHVASAAIIGALSEVALAFGASGGAADIVDLFDRACDVTESVGRFATARHAADGA